MSLARRSPFSAWENLRKSQTLPGQDSSTIYTNEQLGRYFQDPVEWIAEEWPEHAILQYIREDIDRREFARSWPGLWRRALIWGGKETSKSVILATCALWHNIIMSWKLNRRVDVGIMAGSLDQAGIDLTYLSGLLQEGIGTRRFYNPRTTTAHEITIRNGARSWVYAASFYSAHGEHPFLMIIDEAILASGVRGGKVVEAGLASVTTGGRSILATAPYWQDKIFMNDWKYATEREYRRFGPWLKHPWDEQGNPVRRRYWIPQEIEQREAILAQRDIHSNYKVFWEAKVESGVGNLFNPAYIDMSSSQPIALDPETSLPILIEGAPKAIGVDPGFGSSMFGILGSQMADGKITVTFTEELDRPNFTETVALIAKIYHKDQYDMIYVDSAFPAMARELDGFNCAVDTIVFSKELSDMIESTRIMLEPPMNIIQISPIFSDLVWQLKNAQWDKGGTKVMKTGDLTFDLLDALLINLRHYARRQPNPVMRT